jgi:hypothetical protein
VTTAVIYPEPIPAPPPPKPSGCPDAYGHLRLWSMSERTWRLSAAQKVAEMSYGCPYCLLPVDPIVSRSPLLPRTRSW